MKASVNIVKVLQILIIKLIKKKMQQVAQESTMNEKCHTLYIQNLNEKVKLDDLKQVLFYVFSQCGDVLGVSAKKNIHLRGQAFVVFKEAKAAEEAATKLNGQKLLGKELRISYAKQESELILKDKPGYVPRKRTEYSCKPKQGGSKVNGKSNKQQQGDIEMNLPNKTLYVIGLPKVTTDMLISLFQKSAGFKEVRYFEPKNCAFVEFEDELQSDIAMRVLQGYKLTPEYAMNIQFAKAATNE